MYIYNTLPTSLLDSAIADNSSLFEENSYSYIVIYSYSQGDYQIEFCNEYKQINLLDIPMIVGIKYYRK